MAFKYAEKEPDLAIDTNSGRTGGPIGADLKRRIWFTLGALIVFRVGTYLPIPGLDPEVLSQHWWWSYPDYLHNFPSATPWPQNNVVFDIVDTLSGGALKRLSVFALGVMPYISALVIVQLISAAWPTFGRGTTGEDAGRRRLGRYVRYCTVALAAAQGYGLAVALEGIIEWIPDPGWVFRASTMTTLACGTLFLVWLGGQITKRGVGNGIALILFAGFAAGFPEAFILIFEMIRTGGLPILSLVLLIVMAVTITGLIVFMELARRRVFVDFHGEQASGGRPGGQAHFSLRLNPANMIPPIAASLLTSIFLIPYDIPLVSFPIGLSPELFPYQMTARDELTWLWPLLQHFGRGEPIYVLAYAALIVFFCFLCRHWTHDPAGIARSLESSGKAIKGIRPGRNTADYLSYLQIRLTAIAAGCLVAVSIIAELLVPIQVPLFPLGATGPVVMVLATLALFARIGALQRGA